MGLKGTNGVVCRLACDICHDPGSAPDTATETSVAALTPFW